MKNTEIGMIPDDWEVKNIGTTCNVFTGGEVPLKHSKDKNEVFKYPIYSNGRDVYGYYTGFVIGDDSVCISSIGENTGDVFFYKGEFTPVIRLKVVVPKSNKISTKYLYYYLKAHKIDGTKNGGIPNINANDVKILNFPLPPTLAEQQKIAKALSDVDNVISTLEKLITKKKNLKQGTMQQLLTGKKRLPGFAPTVVEPVETTKFKQTEIGEIPEDWKVKELGEICMNFSYGVGAEAKKFDGNIKYIRITDIDESSHLFSPQPITSPSFYTSKSFVKENDLLFARTGASVGKSYIYSVNDGKLVFAGFLMRCNVSNADSKFIFYNTLTTRYDTWVTSESMRSGQPGLNLEQLKKFLVPIPSKPEQTAIANVFSSMDKEIEALNTKLEKYRNLKTGMMQQLLTGKIRLR